MTGPVTEALRTSEVPSAVAPATPVLNEHLKRLAVVADVMENLESRTRNLVHVYLHPNPGDPPEQNKEIPTTDNFVGILHKLISRLEKSAKEIDVHVTDFEHSWNL